MLVYTAQHSEVARTDESLRGIKEFVDDGAGNLVAGTLCGLLRQDEDGVWRRTPLVKRGRGRDVIQSACGGNGLLFVSKQGSNTPIHRSTDGGRTFGRILCRARNFDHLFYDTRTDTLATWCWQAHRKLSLAIADASTRTEKIERENDFAPWPAGVTELARPRGIHCLHDDHVYSLSDGWFCMVRAPSAEGPWEEFEMEGVTGPHYSAIASTGTHLYLATSDGLWRSVDGSAWDKLFASEDYFTGLVADSKGHLVASTQKRLLYTCDDGATWRSDAPEDALTGAMHLHDGLLYMAPRAMSGEPLLTADDHPAIWIVDLAASSS
ncbi:MAG: hypothetical protein AAF721_13930 [Myxococcota bacterium]